MIEHTIQTNATLIDDDWAAFLAEHGFLFGVSVDGPLSCMRRTAGTRAARRSGRLADEVMPWLARMDARASTAP